MKPIRKGKGKNRGFWVWESENPPVIYREPIREGRSPNALNRRRVREMKDGS